MLLPREHGTYGEVVFPLVSALLIGAVNPGSWALVALATGGYLAHEGLLVITGRRGPRAAREQRRAAILSLATFGGLAAMGLAVAVTTLTRDAWIATGVVGVLSILGVATAFVGRQHSLPGELLAAAALPGWCAPVAIQGGVDMTTAATLWAVWSIGFAAATCVVHVVIARSKQQPFGLALAGTFGFAIAGPLVSVAAIPLTLTAVSLVWLPVSARRLRHVGWSVIAASVLTLIVVLQVL